MWRNRDQEDVEGIVVITLPSYFLFVLLQGLLLRKRCSSSFKVKERSIRASLSLRLMSRWGWRRRAWLSRGSVSVNSREISSLSLSLSFRLKLWAKFYELFLIFIAFYSVFFTFKRDIHTHRLTLFTWGFCSIHQWSRVYEPESHKLWVDEF